MNKKELEDNLRDLREHCIINKNQARRREDDSSHRAYTTILKHINKILGVK